MPRPLVLHLLPLLTAAAVAIAFAPWACAAARTTATDDDGWELPPLDIVNYPSDLDIRALVVDSEGRFRGTPLVIKGASPSLWPALAAWEDKDHVTRVLDGAGVVLKYRNASADAAVFVPVGERRLSVGAIDDFEITYAGVGAFMAAARAGEAELAAEIEAAKLGREGAVEYTSRAVYHTGDVETVWAELVDGAVELDSLKFDAVESRTMMWIGTHRVTANTHYDTAYNLHAQVVGRKKWVLYPPRMSEPLDPYPWLHVHYRQASRMPEDLTADGSVFDGRRYATTLSPGDVLYVPPFWWHTVSAVGTAMSMSVLSPAAGERTASELLASEHPLLPPGTKDTLAARSLTVVAAIRALALATPGVAFADALSLVRARYDHLEPDIELAGGRSRVERLLGKSQCFAGERARLEQQQQQQQQQQQGYDPHAPVSSSSLSSSSFTRRSSLDVAAVWETAVAWASSRASLLAAIEAGGRRVILADLMEVVAEPVVGGDGRAVGRFWAMCTSP